MPLVWLLLVSMKLPPATRRRRTARESSLDAPSPNPRQGHDCPDQVQDAEAGRPGLCNRSISFGRIMAGNGRPGR